MTHFINELISGVFTTVGALTFQSLNWSTDVIYLPNGLYIYMALLILNHRNTFAVSFLDGPILAGLR